MARRRHSCQVDGSRVRPPDAVLRVSRRSLLRRIDRRRGATSGQALETVVMPFLIVQPYTGKPDRLRTAILVRSFDTAAEAFAYLDRLQARLAQSEIPPGDIELVVVDEQRRRVTSSGELLQ